MGTSIESLFARACLERAVDTPEALEALLASADLTAEDREELRAQAARLLRYRRLVRNNLTGVTEKMLPGIIDIQSGTYDDPNAVPPKAHIQVAERIGWMERAHELPTFERFPPPG